MPPHQRARQRLDGERRDLVRACTAEADARRWAEVPPVDEILLAVDSILSDLDPARPASLTTHERHARLDRGMERLRELRRDLVAVTPRAPRPAPVVSIACGREEPF